MSKIKPVKVVRWLHVRWSVEDKHLALADMYLRLRARANGCVVRLGPDDMVVANVQRSAEALGNDAGTLVEATTWLYNYLLEACPRGTRNQYKEFLIQVEW